jgi:hypothetical protein
MRNQRSSSASAIRSSFPARFLTSRIRHLPSLSGCSIWLASLDRPDRSPAHAEIQQRVRERERRGEAGEQRQGGAGVEMGEAHPAGWRWLRAGAGSGHGCPTCDAEQRRREGDREQAGANNAVLVIARSSDRVVHGVHSSTSLLSLTGLTGARWTAPLRPRPVADRMPACAEKVPPHLRRVPAAVGPTRSGRERESCARCDPTRRIPSACTRRFGRLCSSDPVDRLVREPRGGLGERTGI